MPGEAILTRDSERAVRGSGRVDDCGGLEHGAAAECDPLGLAVQVELGDVVVQHLGAELLGLLLHLGHEVRALDAVGEAGEVLDLGGLHQLTADLDRARHEHRVQVRPSCVDRSGEPRGTGADDDDLSHCLSLLSHASTHGSRAAFRGPGGAHEVAIEGRSGNASAPAWGHAVPARCARPAGPAACALGLPVPAPVRDLNLRGRPPLASGRTQGRGIPRRAPRGRRRADPARPGGSTG